MITIKPYTRFNDESERNVVLTRSARVVPVLGTQCQKQNALLKCIGSPNNSDKTTDIIVCDFDDNDQCLRLSRDRHFGPYVAACKVPNYEWVYQNKQWACALSETQIEADIPRGEDVCLKFDPADNECKRGFLSNSYQNEECQVSNKPLGPGMYSLKCKDLNFNYTLDTKLPPKIQIQLNEQYQNLFAHKYESPHREHGTNFYQCLSAD